MAEDVLQNLKDSLNEEKWTRATLNNYTINNFKELDKILESAVEQGIEDEVKEICDEHLHHTKNSIIGLYISGLIAISRQILDDTNLIMLVNIFADNHKWNIVEFLCNRILEYGENKYALRTLAECHNNENQIDKMYEAWKRLIRVDHDETEIVKQLAEKEEEKGNIEEAVDYYKKAIHRYISKKQFANVKETWKKLIEYSPDEKEFFFNIEAKIAKNLNEERATQLLTDLYPYYYEKKEWDTAIEILMRILNYDSHNSWARSEIVDCFRNKYANHSQLEEYIKLSNLTQSWRNVHDAIADFEKHISFDEGNFVYHKSWGIGRIRSISDDTIVVDFARKRNHEMSLKMAINALTVLPKYHIWVLRSVWSKEKLREKIKNNIVWALKTLIKSFDNEADMKKIKAELVPGILTQKEWPTWSSEARKILKTNPAFGSHPEKRDKYIVRDKPISFEEKTYNRFKAERNFFGRVQIIQEFLKHSTPDSEYFAEMFTYFSNFLKAYSTVNEHVVGSFLVVKRIVSYYPYLNEGITLNFKDLFNEIKNIEELFSKIENNDLKREFLTNIKRNIGNWPDYFVQLFPYYMARYVIDELVHNDRFDKMNELFIKIHDRYRELREPFIWLAKNCTQEEWFPKIDVDYEKVLISLIHLLDITNREIANRKDVSVNRKLNRQIQTFLFKDNVLDQYLMSADKDSAHRIYTLLADVQDIDHLLIELKHKIKERFPDFKFYGEEEKGTLSRGLIVTKDSYERKQKELKNIIDVEIPKNSKEIGAAIELGDLKENAEYKAAKERQDMLNNNASRLKEDLQKAQIYTKDDIDTSKISYGTKVTLYNHNKDKDENITILGPWESDPDNNIISYLSPLGNALWGHEKKEELDFEINETKYHYTVKEIEAVKI